MTEVCFSGPTWVELGRYRRERGLAVTPSPHEQTPLVLPLGQSMKPLTRAALHTIVKGILGWLQDSDNKAR